jgi:hypothetical protein
MISMSTQLGYAKVYFAKEDFGKMLKLKDVENLTISNIENDGYGILTLTIATPIDNVTNNRVKISEDYNNTKRYKIPIEEKSNENHIDRTSIGKMLYERVWAVIDHTIVDENLSRNFYFSIQIELEQIYKEYGQVSLNEVIDRLNETNDKNKKYLYEKYDPLSEADRQLKEVVFANDIVIGNIKNKINESNK